MGNKNKKSINPLLALGAIAGAAAIAAISTKRIKDKDKDIVTISRKFDVEEDERQIYFIGGGLASLSGAAYLIRDCNIKGKNIHVLEGRKVLGGSNDGSGNSESGYICRGIRMFNKDTYENFFELFDSIPSLEKPEISVTKEIFNFNNLHPTKEQARLIDRNGKVIDSNKMGLNTLETILLGRLLTVSEEKLEGFKIEDWFKNTPHFFTTNFWYMWQTTFSFQRWSSLFEFKRYIQRMILNMSELETLEWVMRTEFNQYESIILPLKTYLDKHSVNFNTNSKVIDIEFENKNEITAKKIIIEEEDTERVIDIERGDLCIMTNSCMIDSTTVGSYKKSPEYIPNKSISGELWSKVAKKKIGLGNPEIFYSNAEQTNWESFTITCKGNRLLKDLEKLSGNIPGSGALMTLKDSNWLLNIVVPAQPHFKNQPLDTTVLWGYGLYTGKIGNYVEKKMRECTGEEILEELLKHLHIEENLKEIKESIINVIPCMMPYINAQFQPRKITDRPKVVPEGSTNFAMISQFVEIPEDIVFTEEYSVRAARIAVYTLLGIKDKKVIPVTQNRNNTKLIFKGLKKALK
ncbi:oleate hydratase [Clostridium sp.]|uniref:oleate hydratase n=1 Tax=Clostridium sp. TaxID=1506 RepID=UPI002613CDCD|nr:oleate hydratase [Clostridium sp.]